MDPHAVKPLYDALHRYAGWLNRERAARQVRADVAALGTALDACDDPLPQLQALDAAVAQLPSGELKKMMRTAADQMRRALGAEGR
jgi:hypothetical protein